MTAATLPQHVVLASTCATLAGKQLAIVGSGKAAVALQRDFAYGVPIECTALPCPEDIGEVN